MKKLIFALGFVSSMTIHCKYILSPLLLYPVIFLNQLVKNQRKFKNL